MLRYAPRPSPGMLQRLAADRRTARWNTRPARPAAIFGVAGSIVPAGMQGGGSDQAGGGNVLHVWLRRGQQHITARLSGVAADTRQPGSGTNRSY